MDQRKIVLSLVALGTLLASVALALNMFGKGIHSTFAQSPGVTATDYWLNGGQEPWGITFDSRGNVWVAVPGCDPSPTCGSSTPPGKIEEFNPVYSSWIATYQLPAGYAQPLFLAFDANGNLWFPMPMSNSIGMLNLQTKTFNQYPVPTAASGPWDLAIDHSGNVWFTEHYTNKIGKFDPSTQIMTEYATPSANSLPYGIVVDASNNIWFTENNSAVAQIGEYTAGGTMYEYKIRANPPGGLTPHLITIDPNGNIWWTEGWVGMLGELVITKAAPGTNNGVTEYAYPTTCGNCGTHTSGIGVDSNGLVWFDDALQGIFGSFPDSGQGSFSIYPAPTPRHPHDGLNVDSQNRIWFTEEFANKLAVAVQNISPTPTPSPSPSVSVSPSPLPSPSPTLTPSPTPTLTPSPTPGVTLAQDTFQRANQTHWGTASDGLIWGGDANTSSVFSIQQNAGQLSRGGNNYSAVLGPAVANAEVLFSGSMSNFNYVNIGAVLRWTDGNNWYKAYIDGKSLVLQKKVNGAVTTLKTVPFAAKAGTSYTLRFNIVGSTLSVKVWQTGTTEPAAWMATATDSSLASGFCGLRVLDQSGAITAVTSFLAMAQ